MRLGALLGPLKPGDPQFLADQARQLEDAGYDSLWSVHATGRGFMVADPFLALTVAATVTERVELGTAILQLPLYEPADVALKSYTLMQVSGNRFSLGVGAGSTASDHQLHHRPFDQRFHRFNECLASLRHIFETGSEGEVTLAPWDVVQGGPPLIYGTWGNGVARAASEFSGWMGSGMHRSPEELEQALQGYRDAGGQRAMVTTLVISADTDPGELQTLLQRFRDAGFDDAVVMFTPGAPDPVTVRRLLD